MMSKFDLWGIVREPGLSSNQRTVFTVHLEGGIRKVLRTRKDVVIFLEKHPEIDIPIGDFVFKKLTDSVDNEMVEESLVADTKTAENDLKRKNVPATDPSFEAKVSRVMEKPSANPDEAFTIILPKLHQIRKNHSKPSVNLSDTAVSELKGLLTDTENVEPIWFIKQLCKNDEIFTALQSVFYVSVESEMELNSMKHSKSVMMEFPPQNSKNFYCEVLEEAILKMPNMLSFLVNIVDSGEVNLTPSYAIRIANLLCEIMHTRDKRHSALNKINSLHLMFQRSAVANLKIFQTKGHCCGHTEGTRLVEEIAELAEFGIWAASLLWTMLI